MYALPVQNLPKGNEGFTRSNSTATGVLLAGMQVKSLCGQGEKTFSQSYSHKSPEHEEERFWQGFGLKGGTRPSAMRTVGLLKVGELSLA
jgi:hypothetical protein